ncbi:MAG: putative S-adenosylmethionine-dependent methyltransferase [Microgenomates bacterium OLB23]|nr:MAG: putative S-adenosylmethionine-dependent methyltransferase [Microgenomates bacterium OLB23]
MLVKESGFGSIAKAHNPTSLARAIVNVVTHKNITSLFTKKRYNFYVLMVYSSLINSILRSEVDPAFAKRARFILEHIVKNKPARVLEVGCGRGFYIKSVSMFDFPREIVGIDVNAHYLEAAKRLNKDNKRVLLKKGSIYKLPFKDGYFDAVICSEVLEHLDNDLAGARELHRVLKKGGIALFSVPHQQYPFLWDPLNKFLSLFKTHVPKHIWWLAGIWADHERLYTVTSFQDVLKAAGFAPMRVKKNCALVLAFFLIFYSMA